MKRAFTIVELLVVIGIMALTAAILLPVLWQSQEKARQTTCISAQRQTALALIQYREENGGWPVDEWLSWNQNRTPLSCPDMKRSIVKPTDMHTNPKVNPDFAFNSYLGLSNKDPKYPATTVLIADAPQGTWLLTDPDPCQTIDAQHKPDCDKQQEKAYERHNGGADYAFVDGHVKWFKVSQIVPSQLLDAQGGTYLNTGNDGTMPTFMTWTKGDSPTP